MCTATYLPLSSNGFILTHSRDEKAIRPAAYPPRAVSIGGQSVTFPQDPQGRGTWIAQSADLTVCLLNGAFGPHQPQPPYKHSRGLVVLDVFDYVSVDSFINQYSFTGIEPFTLLLAETGRLLELRWTGERVFTNEKESTKPHIWSSVTLYAPDVIGKREQWFNTWWRQQSSPSVNDIRGFHQSAGDGDPENDLRMNRHGETYTLSLTSIWHDGGRVEMIYEDFVQNTLTQQPITPSHAIA